MTLEPAPSPKTQSPNPPIPNSPIPNSQTSEGEPTAETVPEELSSEAALQVLQELSNEASSEALPIPDVSDDATEKGAEEIGTEAEAGEASDSPDPIKAALNRLSNPEKKAEMLAAIASGQALFERGRYKSAIAEFKAALALANPMGARGGEIQMWLVNAYIASGNEAEGLALCRKLIVHPDLDTKQQSKRMLYILEAPELEMKPEWVTKIPVLGEFDDDKQIRYAQRSKKKRRRKAKAEPEPLDLSEVNTEDNQFEWIALVGVVLTLGALIWLS